jgi:capsular polysaccharide transport system permease protein
MSEMHVPRFPRRPPRGSFEIFINSLRAFTLREIGSRYGSTRLGWLWGLVDPMMTIGFLLGLHGIVRGHNSHIYGADPMIFFIWGVTGFFMWQHACSACMGVCNSSRGLFNYRQIRPIDIMIVKALLEVAELGVAMLAFLLIFAYFGKTTTVEDGALLIVLFVMIFVTGFVFGFLFEVYSTAFPELRRIFSFILRPMLFISGLFFTIGSLSERAQAFFLWNPVLHLIDLIHGAVLPGYESPGSLGYVLLVDGVLLVIALAGYRRYMHELI